MKQALHIFRKDIRYLRLEICLLTALAFVFGLVTVRLNQGGWSESLFQLTAVYTIAKLIHAEAIPGDRQFWLTRPYRSASLATAKLLFILCFITVPMACAQIYILTEKGFPFLASVPGLLCSQTLLFFAAALPVAALATVTSSFVPFLLSALVLAFVAFAGPTSAMLFWMPGHAGIPRSVSWLRFLLVESSVAAIAVVVIVKQYRDRCTDWSRYFAFLALNVAGALFLFLPPSSVLTLQSWLSKEPSLAAPISVSLARKATDIAGPVSPVEMRIPLTLEATGVPVSTELRSDANSTVFEWPGGPVVEAKTTGWSRRAMSETSATFTLLVPMDKAVYEKVRNTPATVKITTWLTLFGDDETRSIVLDQGPANVQDGLQCGKQIFLRDMEAIRCWSFFRWPSRLVYARSGSGENEFANTLVSYSPLPADMELDGSQSQWGDRATSDTVTIVTKKPLAHFKREARLEGLRLADMEMARPPGIRR